MINCAVRVNIGSPVFLFARAAKSADFKEALNKSDVQITPSDFSSDCAKGASCRISSDFCAIWREICK